ncbi:MAG TPA: M48 family metalloprotease [Bryobacteraceae bacterium]|nr:M48 family metalloprotease [Bryobacteraceae bacterium]
MMHISRITSALVLGQSLFLGAALVVLPVHAQTDPPSSQSAAAPARNLDEAVDRIIANEGELYKRLKTVHPVVETYIQRMQKDADFGAVPKTDYYFLGKLDVSHSVKSDSFIPDPSLPKRMLGVFSNLVSINFLPGGFATMVMMDPGQFDRQHYQFNYLRREFLGDVRCLVFDVLPQKGSGKGRFVGRMWVEDQGYHVVRFNGTYGEAALNHSYSHFDSWRINCGPDLWLPAYVYTEESSQKYELGLKTIQFKGQTRLWGYESKKDRMEEAFTNMTVEGVDDRSDSAAENSPVEAMRMWERQAEDNVIDRLQNANLMAPSGPVNKVLQTVLQNLEVTNNISVTPDVRVRILLTTPLESFTLGHTIVISRGLLDVLPDEANLAAVLAHELGHIVLGHQLDTKYAFADRMFFDDDESFSKIDVGRSAADEEAADKKAVEMLKKSPYASKLPQVGLFLRALSARSGDMPHLIRPMMGGRLANGKQDQRLTAIMEMAPPLHLTRTDEIEALPLGSRIKLDPWSDRLALVKTQNVPLQSVKEKVPFEVTPFMPHLTRLNQTQSVAAAESAVSK